MINSRFILVFLSAFFYESVTKYMIVTFNSLFQELNWHHLVFQFVQVCQLDRGKIPSQFLIGQIQPNHLSCEKCILAQLLMQQSQYLNTVYLDLLIPFISLLAFLVGYYYFTINMGKIQSFGQYFPDNTMSVNAEQAQNLIKQNQNNPNFKIIDVRTCLQRRLSHIPDSQHIPLSDLNDHLSEFKKQNTYLVYCRSGARSHTATLTLKQNGFNAINLAGGLNNWRQDTSSNCQIM